MTIFDGLRMHIEDDNAARVESLLGVGDFDINTLDREKGSLLHYSASLGAPKVCELLIRMGADVSLADRAGMTPLHLSVEKERRAWKKDGVVCRLLIAHGANLDAQSRNGRTALHEAVRAANVVAVEALIGAGANLQLVDNRESTPLHDACRSFYVQGVAIARMLLDAGADIDLSGRGGWTALHNAAFFNKQAQCELLVERGADTKAIACNVKKNVTPFQMAVSQGHGPLVEWFLDHVGEDLNQQTLSGRKLIQTAKHNSPAKAVLLSRAAQSKIAASIKGEAVAPHDNTPKVGSKALSPL